MLTWSWRHTLIVWERITGQKLFVSKRQQQTATPNDRGRKYTVKAVLQGILILLYNKVQRHVSFSNSWDNVLTNDHRDEKASNTIFIFPTFPVPQRYIRTGHVCIVFQPDTFLVKNLWEDQSQTLSVRFFQLLEVSRDFKSISLLQWHLDA